MFELYTTDVLDLDQLDLFERAKFICFSISLIMKLGVISNSFFGYLSHPYNINDFTLFVNNLYDSFSIGTLFPYT